MKLKFSAVAVIMVLAASFGFAQDSLEDYYQEGKDAGIFDMKPEVSINRVNLSEEGHAFADSLETIYAEAASKIPDMTKDGFLSNGIASYLAKKEIMKKIDVYEIEEIAEYKDSKNYDYSEFYSNIEGYLSEAELRASESLFFIINEDCRAKSERSEKFGNLGCWDVNVELYQKKMAIINKLKTEF